MIIICPECTAKFKINGELIKENGRFVRCSNCSHEWVVMPLKNNNDDLSGATPTEESILNNISLSAEDFVSNKEEIAGKPFIGSFYVRACFILMLIASMVFASTSFLITKRDVVVAHYPFMQNIYDSFDLYDTKGLVIEDIFGEFNEIDAQSADFKELNIALAVRNLGESAKVLNAVNILIFDSKRNVLDQVVINEDSVLLPNDVDLIEGRLNQIPKEAKYFSVEVGSALDFTMNNTNYNKLRG